MVTALGQVWHPEHFVCAVCNVELSHTGFFEREGRPYCDKDYHQLFAPRCAYCKGPILKVRKRCRCVLCFTNDRTMPRPHIMFPDPHSDRGEDMRWCVAHSPHDLPSRLIKNIPGLFCLGLYTTLKTFVRL